MADSQATLTSEQRDALLRFARVCARTALRAGDAPHDRPVIQGRFGGAFVTFWNGKTLRGCIGRFGSTTDIVETVAGVTRGSLTDPRFSRNPITAAELDRLTIEVSLLTDPVRTDDPPSLVPGTHGILICSGRQSGCFLPKVASDRGWSAEEFLSNCCTMKAGLDADAWRKPETEVLLFTAEVFSDTERG